MRRPEAPACLPCHQVELPQERQPGSTAPPSIRRRGPSGPNQPSPLRSLTSSFEPRFPRAYRRPRGGAPGGFLRQTLLQSPSVPGSSIPPGQARPGPPPPSRDPLKTTELPASLARKCRGTRVASKPQASHGDPAWRLGKAGAKLSLFGRSVPFPPPPLTSASRALCFSRRRLRRPSAFRCPSLPSQSIAKRRRTPSILILPAEDWGGGGTERHRLEKTTRRRRRSPPASESRSG